MEPFQSARFKPDVVVQKQAVGGRPLVQKELPVLRQSAPRQVTEEGHVPALGLQYPHHGFRSRLLPPGLVFRLVTDDHPKTGTGLPRQPRQRDGKFGRAVAGGDQHIGRDGLGAQRGCPHAADVLTLMSIGLEGCVSRFGAGQVLLR